MSKQQLVNGQQGKKKAHAWKLLCIPSITVQKKGEIHLCTEVGNSYNKSKQTNQKEHLYTEVGNSYKKSKPTTGQSGTQMNTCRSDGSSERVCLG